MFFYVNKTKLKLESKNNQVKLYAAVVIRRLLQAKETEIVNAVWKELDAKTKENVKGNVLKALIDINEKSLKYKICDTLTTICENVYQDEETWVELLNYIYTALNASLSEENNLSIETGLYLLSNIFGFVYDELSKAVPLYIQAFQNYFRSQSLSLKTRTVQAISEIMCIVHKRDVKKFRDFVISILQTTLACFEDPKEENNVNKRLFIFS